MTLDPPSTGYPYGIFCSVPATQAASIQPTPFPDPPLCNQASLKCCRITHLGVYMELVKYTENVTLEQCHRMHASEINFFKLSISQLPHHSPSPFAVLNTHLTLPGIYINFSHSVSLTWWSGPLLCMACTSQLWFLFQFLNRGTCT
jgi:hypothetical protein